MTLLNSSQAAKLLGIKKSTLHAWVSRGEGPKISERSANGCYRIDRSDLEQFKVQHTLARLSRGIKSYVNGALV